MPDDADSSYIQPCCLSNIPIAVPLRGFLADVDVALSVRCPHLPGDDRPCVSRCPPAVERMSVILHAVDLAPGRQAGPPAAFPCYI